jgi:Holliday junction resolvase RusA-like endonuclease
MIEFFIQGTPRPSGSKSAGAFKDKEGRTRTFVRDSSGVKGKNWRQDVRAGAIQAFEDTPPIEGPIQVRLEFLFSRPLHHYQAGKRDRPLKSDAPDYHTKAPDADKLSRSVLDALKGVAWKDDAQVARKLVIKRYMSEVHRYEGVYVEISPAPTR